MPSIIKHEGGGPHGVYIPDKILTAGNPVSFDAQDDGRFLAEIQNAWLIVACPVNSTHVVAPVPTRIEPAKWLSSKHVLTLEQYRFKGDPNELIKVELAFFVSKRDTSTQTVVIHFQPERV